MQPRKDSLSKLSTVMIAAALSLGSAATAQGLEVIEDQSNLYISTPSLQTRATRKVRLDNGLEAYLISDPGSPVSGAALSVEVGSWQDPINAQGLAHFNEHLLFLGNAKYPEENGFRRFLDDHGGRSNAYTTDQVTNYMFEVSNQSFAEALDQFGHFFVDPNFDQSAMGREQHAVDQEFARAIEDDNWRRIMVEKKLANPEHPHSRFNFGNVSTLHHIKSEEARAWFESHYSANLMHLVVCSPLPLDQLQELVLASFSEIPNRELGPFVVEGTKRAPHLAGQMVYIAPRKELRELDLSWELPYDHETSTDTHAADMVSFVLGYEGEGSLLAQLKEEGLAEGLYTGTSVHKKAHTPTYTLRMRLALTPEGVAAKDQVIERCFQQVAKVQAEGVPSYLYQEIQRMSRLSYEFQTRQPVFELLSHHALAMTQEDLATYPRKTILAESYDAEAIGEVTRQLTADSCHMCLTANPTEVGVETEKQEPWMGAEYVVQSLLDRQHRWLAVDEHPGLKIPARNPYVPSRLDVTHSGTPSHEAPTPKLITDDPYGMFYFAQDTTYMVPELAWTFTIKSEAFEPGDAQSAVLLDLLVRSVDEKLAQTGYDAMMAGLSYHLGSSEEGLQLTIAGYSEKAATLLEHVLIALKSGLPSERDFDLYHDSLRRDYTNFAKEKPIDQAIGLVKEVIYRDYVSHASRARALREVDFHKFVLFFDDFAKNTYVQGMLFGNMDERVGKDVVGLWRTDFQEDPFPEGATMKPAVVHLPKEEGPFYLSKRAKVNGTAAILMAEVGPFNFKRRAAQQILGAGIEEPFFSELRTRQQTGYVVWSWEQEIERQMFQFFAVQSNTLDGRDLLARYEQMIDGFLRDLEDKSVSPERFEQIKQALITKIEEMPKNPKEMVGRLATLAFRFDGDFDWMEKRVKGLNDLSYAEFTKFAEESLGKANKRRLGVLIQGYLPEKTALRYHPARSTTKLRGEAEYRERD